MEEGVDVLHGLVFDVLAVCGEGLVVRVVVGRPRGFAVFEGEEGLACAPSEGCLGERE